MKVKVLNIVFIIVTYCPILLLDIYLLISVRDCTLPKFTSAGELLGSKTLLAAGPGFSLS